MKHSAAVLLLLRICRYSTVNSIFGPIFPFIMLRLVSNTVLAVALPSDRLYTFGCKFNLGLEIGGPNC